MNNKHKYESPPAHIKKNRNRNCFLFQGYSAALGEDLSGVNWGEFEDECRAMQIPDNRTAFLLNNYLKTHFYRKAVDVSKITCNF